MPAIVPSPVARRRTSCSLAAVGVLLAAASACSTAARTADVGSGGDEQRGDVDGMAPDADADPRDARDDPAPDLAPADGSGPSDAPTADAEPGVDAHDAVDVAPVDAAGSDADAAGIDVTGPEADAPAADDQDAGDTDDPAPPPGPVVVIAGDSWSSGLVGTMPPEVAAWGIPDATYRWEFTANAGSQAQTWRANAHPPAIGGGVDTARPRMLDALQTALDEPTPADVLVLVLGGNDLNRECDEGWGEWPAWRQELALDAIGSDLAFVVDAALEGRPGLEVVIFGYDYFHFEFLRAFGLRLDGLDTTSYNEANVALGRHQRRIVESRLQAHYVNNYGTLQHVWGDRIHPPFSRPNPLTGYPEYGPGIAPRPTGPPEYAVYPGGFYTYPAPLDAMPDGIHPSPEAMGRLVRNALEQVLGDLLLER